MTNDKYNIVDRSSLVFHQPGYSFISELWPGKTFACGSTYALAELTAIAAWPKQTAIRSSLTGAPAISPAAKTPGRLVSKCGPTLIARPLPSISRPQVLIGPESAL